MAVANAPIDPQRWNEAIESGSAALRVKYDPKRDFFAITLGKPRPAYSQDHDGTLTQIDIETNEVVGVYIYDFLHAWVPRHPELASWWRRQNPGYGRSGNLVLRMLNALRQRPQRGVAPPMPPRVARLMEVPCT